MRHVMAYVCMLESSIIACHWIVTLLQLRSHDMTLAELAELHGGAPHPVQGLACRWPS